MLFIQNRIDLFSRIAKRTLLLKRLFILKMRLWSKSCVPIYNSRALGWIYKMCFYHEKSESIFSSSATEIVPKFASKILYPLKYFLPLLSFPFWNGHENFDGSLFQGLGMEPAKFLNWVWFNFPALTKNLSKRNLIGLDFYF